MLRHYLKSQLWVLLGGGLVGPVYLIVYYKFLSAEDRHYVGWLLWVGWLITVADVLIALALASYRAKSTAKASNIPLTSPLDLRSASPALRHQLQDVVRRSAAARPSPAFASGARPSAAQRLQELAGLHANEAITDDEYAERRRQIISEI